MAKRKRDRFSRLKQSLKDAGGVTTAGTPIDDYLNFLKGVNNITMDRRPSSAAMARFSVGVIPFGLSPSTTPVRYLATMTNQAELIRAQAVVSENSFGISKTLTGVVPSPLFCPAYCKVFMTLLAEVPTSQSSKILVSNPAYKRLKGRSGSIPFGRTLTNVIDATTGVAETALSDVEEEDVKRSLAAELKGKVGSTHKVKGVSFVSEIWLTTKNVPGAIGTLPAAIQTG